MSPYICVFFQKVIQLILNWVKVGVVKHVCWRCVQQLVEVGSHNSSSLCQDHYQVILKGVEMFL